MDASRLSGKHRFEHYIGAMWQKNSGDDKALNAFSVFHPTGLMLFTSKRQKFGKLIFLISLTRTTTGVILSPNSNITLLNKINCRIGFNFVDI